MDPAQLSQLVHKAEAINATLEKIESVLSRIADKMEALNLAVDHERNVQLKRIADKMEGFDNYMYDIAQMLRNH